MSTHPHDATAYRGTRITDGVHCWVCEHHPARPWGDMCCDYGLHHQGIAKWGTTFLQLFPDCPHGACHCGGAGQPCDHSATEETT